MKRTFVALAMVVLALALVQICPAASNDNHTVTVNVSTINEINVDQDVVLTIDAATAGANPDSVTDNTTANLFWTSNSNGNEKKITVKLQAAAVHTLKVVAQNINGTGAKAGTAASVVTLTTSDQNLITTIQKTAAHCDLKYTAIATAVEGDDDDLSTVIFTITNAS